MLRILHIVQGMNRGGIETLLMSLYRKLDRTRVQFDFLVHTDSEGAYDKEIKELGGKIYNISPRSKGIVKNRKELISFFKEHTEYKIIHQHVSSLTYIQPIKIAKENNVPVRIIHGHNTKQGGHKIHEIIHRVNKTAIKKYATHYFACSEDAARWMYGPHKLFQIDYAILNNAIDSKEFTFDMKLRDAIREELNLTDKFVVGHVGRFALQKNHEFLVDVFAEIRKNEKQAVLLLVGDGELKEDIINKINSKGLTDSVVLTGVRSDVPALMNAMDVFVFPSLHEGLGIVAIEAQSTGLKCFVSTEVPEEVMITDNIQRISLDKKSFEWAQEILKIKNGYHRESEIDKVLSSGYDIYEVTNRLQKLYLDLSRSC